MASHRYVSEQGPDWSGWVRPSAITVDWDGRAGIERHAAISDEPQTDPRSNDYFPIAVRSEAGVISVEAPASGLETRIPLPDRRDAWASAPLPISSLQIDGAACPLRDGVAMLPEAHILSEVTLTAAGQPQTRWQATQALDNIARIADSRGEVFEQGLALMAEYAAGLDSLRSVYAYSAWARIGDAISAHVKEAFSDCNAVEKGQAQGDPVAMHRQIDRLALSGIAAYERALMAPRLTPDDDTHYEPGGREFVRDCLVDRGALTHYMTKEAVRSLAVAEAKLTAHAQRRGAAELN